MTVRGYIAVGDDILQIKNVLNGPQRSFIPVTGGFIKGVGAAQGLEAEISPASSDGAMVCKSCLLLLAENRCSYQKVLDKPLFVTAY
jgi:hypothetical protein